MRMACSPGTWDAASELEEERVKMARKLSAGLIPYRVRGKEVEVFLVHPGGPFWAKKDQGSWSIPKGEYSQEEEALDVAKREFWEETGFHAIGNFVELGSVKQPSGKLIHAWAFEGDFDEGNLVSNTFTMEWPRGSGTMREFPEVDRAGWFSIREAEMKILKGQVELLRRLCDRVGFALSESDAECQTGSGGVQGSLL